MHPENETRLLSILIDDTAEQTRAIIDALADDDKRDDVDRSRWRALQRWIQVSDCRVVIPFSARLTGLIPPISIRLRRDTKLLLNLIRTHAVLHQASRGRDSEGRIIATLNDYVAVYDLVADIIAEGVQASVSDHIRETVEAVDRLQRETAPPRSMQWPS